MKKSLTGIVLVGVSLAVSATAMAQSAPAATSKNVREERPNVVNGQLLGRGLLYTVNYERYFLKWLGAGVGAMGFAAGGSGLGMVPIYLSLNPVGDEHSLYISPGVLFAFGAVKDLKSTFSGVLGTAEVGWQMQLRSGFMMRVGVDFLYGDGGFIIWPGITLGGSF